MKGINKLTIILFVLVSLFFVGCQKEITKETTKNVETKQPDDAWNLKIVSDPLKGKFYNSDMDYEILIGMEHKEKLTAYSFCRMLDEKHVKEFKEKNMIEKPMEVPAEWSNYYMNCYEFDGMDWIKNDQLSIDLGKKNYGEIFMERNFAGDNEICAIKSDYLEDGVVSEVYFFENENGQLNEIKGFEYKDTYFAIRMAKRVSENMAIALCRGGMDGHIILYDMVLGETVSECDLSLGEICGFGSDCVYAYNDGMLTIIDDQTLKEINTIVTNGKEDQIAVFVDEEKVYYLDKNGLYCARINEDKEAKICDCDTNISKFLSDGEKLVFINETTLDDEMFTWCRCYDESGEHGTFGCLLSKE